MSIEQASAPVKSLARLEEARETRAFIRREMRRAENQRRWTDAQGWQTELEGVNREIAALVAALGW